MNKCACERSIVTEGMRHVGNRPWRRKDRA